MVTRSLSLTILKRMKVKIEEAINATNYKVTRKNKNQWKLY
ncbi:hypothetical protein SAMN05216556_11075 [Aequorivita viscosa]|uniref:Uncharacterized protein n=1 Tax=Aequorivita viscosa TaxID=797419 RepID=A0A1M6GYY7_9FLAO|nr:hypothetical protein SAMN05216556_11075 [Aequorivita viscosa]SHJ15147.1 hypothetical protein SAMN04487908_11059 [Aequorivita viscosa]